MQELTFESQFLQSEQSESPVSGPKKSIIAIRAIRVAPFRAPKSQKLTFESQFLQFCSPSRPFSPRDGPRKSNIGLGGGGVRIEYSAYCSAPKRVPKTKKVNNFRRSRRGKKNKTYLLFCSMLVVGCTKTRFTLLCKRKIDLPVFCLTAKFPPKLSHEKMI